MITLDTDLTYLTKYYELNTKRQNTNAYKSIDETTQSQAAGKSTSTSATSASSGSSDTTSVQGILEALKLENPENRFIILRQLKHSDLVSLLPLMDKKDLAMGLKFFNKEKLLNLMGSVPKKELVSTLLQMYNQQEMLSLMPSKAMMQFLDNQKIDKKMIMNSLQSTEPYVLSKVYEGTTGTPAGNKSKPELMASLGSFKKEQLLEGISTLAPKEKVGIVESITKEDKKLLLEFKTSSLIAPLEKSTKVEMLDGMKALEPDTMIKMLDKLPPELLSQVVTLLDPAKLAEVLQQNCGDLLSQMAA